MKTKRFKKKLILTKETVADLNLQEQSKVKGGYVSASCPFPPFGCGTYPQNCTAGCPSINPRYCGMETDTCWQIC
jgi:hypothetical protein